MRVLMLSWEYPPVVVGGLGRHVYALATALAGAGHEVTVVSRHADGAPVEEVVEGVRVVRAPADPPLFRLSTPTLLAWTMAFNHSLTRAALHPGATQDYDVVHTHDWLVTHAAVTLKEHLGVPLVATIHATEAGRHRGWLPDEAHDRRPDCGGVPRGGRTAGARTAAPAGRGAGGQRVRAGRHNNLMSLSRRARLGRYGTVAAALAPLSDRRLAALVARATPVGTGIGGDSARLDVEGVPVFVKRIPLTDLERRPEHVMSTANLFGVR